MIIQVPWNKRRESQVQQETEILVFSFKITCTHTPTSFLFLSFRQCIWEPFFRKGRKAICFLRFILWDVWVLKWASGAIILTHSCIFSARKRKFLQTDLMMMMSPDWIYRANLFIFINYTQGLCSWDQNHN